MENIGGVIMILGGLLCALGGWGQLRFSDLFVRMHVATKPSTLGFSMVAIGAMFYIGLHPALPLLFLMIGSQLLTGPVAANQIARAAHKSGLWESDEAEIDELSDKDQ